MFNMKHSILYLLVAMAFLHSNCASSLTQGEEYELTEPLRFYNEGNVGEKVISDCEGVSGGLCSDAHTSCDTVFVCLPNIAAPIPTKCDPGETCNKGKCSKIPSTICEYTDLQFKCKSIGMFPDPSSCKKYNFCVPNPSGNGEIDVTTTECPDGWGYNVANTLCDKKLIKKMCADTDRPIPTCKISGQNAALKGSNSYFYICEPHHINAGTLYPYIYRCPGNTKYAGNYLCR